MSTLAGRHCRACILRIPRTPGDATPAAPRMAPQPSATVSRPQWVPHAETQNSPGSPGFPPVAGYLFEAWHCVPERIHVSVTHTPSPPPPPLPRVISHLKHQSTLPGPVPPPRSTSNKTAASLLIAKGLSALLCAALSLCPNPAAQHTPLLSGIRPCRHAAKCHRAAWAPLGWQTIIMLPHQQLGVLPCWCRSLHAALSSRVARPHLPEIIRVHSLSRAGYRVRRHLGKHLEARSGPRLRGALQQSQ